MSIFAIGDLHLSFDERIDKPMDIYGGYWQDHAEKIRENWIKSVNMDDTVIIAGDISWALKLPEAMDDLSWLHRLPGRKVLFKGNHDLWWTGINRLNRLFDDMSFIQNDCIVAGEFCICGTRGWICPGSDEFKAQDEKIYKRELLRLKMSLEKAEATGRRIIGVMHFPPTNDKLQPSGFTELFSKAGAEQVVYGHLHGEEAFGNGLKGILNGVAYNLVSYDYLKARLKLLAE